jgi:hypothetical protein
MALARLPTWRQEVTPPRGQRVAVTRPPGELWRAYQSVQKGELRAALYEGSNAPHCALIPLADLGFLETGAGRPATRRTEVIELSRKSRPNDPPEEAAANTTLHRAGLLALQSRVRVCLTKDGEPIAGVVLLDDLARLEGTSAEGTA